MTATFRVVVISPPGYRHAAAFHEMAESLYHAIRSLGYPASVEYNRFAAGAIHIVLGSNLVGPSAVGEIPEGSIIYNLEQIDATSKWWHQGLQALVSRCETWDYSERNIETFARLGVSRPVIHVPVGYVPELTRIAASPDEDIDVLFYGSLNDRRRVVLDELKARGLNVVSLFGVYGRERDAYIARAKVVLTLHMYPAKIFEQVRVSYLLSNHKAVVAECDADSAVEPGVENAVRLAPYEKLVDACLELVNRPAERAQLAYAGYRWITRRSFAASLAPQLERLARERRLDRVAPVPRQIRIGGFQVPLDGWLCVDEGNASADIVLRAGHSLPVGRVRDTLRYGRVLLETEGFDLIDAGSWPTRVDDFEGFMHDCARLLRFGGRLKLRVPHDLSVGAWEHPRTRRAFSERSFAVFGDAHLALGWGDCALETTDLQFELSPHGATLKAQGVSVDNLLRTPRAVEHILVTLVRRGYRGLPGAEQPRTDRADLT